MEDIVGFSNVMYFDTWQERYTFILDHEDMDGIVLISLETVEDGETESYPLQVSYKDVLPDETYVKPIVDTPF